MTSLSLPPSISVTLARSLARAGALTFPAPHGWVRVPKAWHQRALRVAALARVLPDAVIAPQRPRSSRWCGVWSRSPSVACVELTPVLAEADDPAASAAEMPRVRIETLRAAFPLREGRFALTEAELGPPCVTAGGAKKIKKDKKAKKEKKAAKKAAKLARQQAGAEMTATLNTAGEPSLNSSQPPAAGGALGKRGRDDAGSGAGGDGDAVDSKRRRA